MSSKERCTASSTERDSDDGLTGSTGYYSQVRCKKLFLTSTQGPELKRCKKKPRQEDAAMKKKVRRCESVRTSYPFPVHNFATPVAAEERDAEWHPLVRLVNEARWELQEMQCDLYDPANGQVRISVLIDMRNYIIETVGGLKRELLCLSCDRSSKVKETIFPHCRDALINIGAGFFLCGLYLIMLGSNFANDDQATAAAYHLRKGFFQKHDDVCHGCGHRNCDSTDCWINSKDEEDEDDSSVGSYC